MNRTLALAASAILCAFPVETLHADHRHFSSVNVAPRVSVRSFSPARSIGTFPHTSFRAAPIARGNFHYTPSIASRSFAFGGRPTYWSARQIQPRIRNYSYSNRFANWALPYPVCRDWDRRHDHEWNGHGYRWLGNSWVIIHGGYGYPSYYYDDNYSPTPYLTINTRDYDTGSSLGAEVQEALAAHGYYRGEIDGDVAPMTRDAIAAYQRDHRLPVTGTINTSLLDSLGLD